MAAVVELAQVTKVYGSLQALADFTLAIEDGEFISLLGPSGCGKTTVLRLIGGFERCDAGSLRIDGQDVAALPPEKRAVNTVFQNYALFPHLTVFDNVAFGLKMAGRKHLEIAGIVHQALRQVRLEGMEQRKPAMLSGGQQQRVAIARAIVNKPRVLLLDEPLSALDYRLRKEMQKELKDLHRQLGITFVLVTHDQDEAFTMSDRVVVMDHGRIEQIGSPREIYEEPVNLHVARFVGEINILDGRVLQRQGDQLTVELEGSRILVKSDRPFSDSQPVHVLLRPEDVYLKVVPAEQAEAMRGPNQLLGLVTESYYRGATYDLVVRLASGKELQVTEFFDEDAETVAYLPGQTVLVEWIGGWEVVLPHA